MAASRPASSKSFCTRHLWMLVVALALAVRSGIPMGYMLDPAAVQPGSFRLVLCSFGTPPGPQQGRAGNASHQAHHSSSPGRVFDENALPHAIHAVALETPP